MTAQAVGKPCMRRRCKCCQRHERAIGAWVAAVKGHERRQRSRAWWRRGPCQPGCIVCAVIGGVVDRD